MDHALLELLRCPESSQRVMLAGFDVVRRLETLRAGGILRDVKGRTVNEVISEGLVCEDGRRFYPIWDGIPVMLKDESIAIRE